MDANNKKFHPDEEKYRFFMSFVLDMAYFLPATRYNLFCRLMNRLAETQIHCRGNQPCKTSLYHGITVAKICLKLDPEISEALLIAAVGHDWDRSCGDKRVNQKDFPYTKEGYEEYKSEHAKKSANIFKLVLQEFYEPELIEQIYNFVLLHEFGGPGELGILDQADGISFFLAKSTNYYRLEGAYYSPTGQPLTSSLLESARQSGFRRKVKFMTESMNPEGILQVTELIKKNLKDYHPTVNAELCELLGISTEKRKNTL